MIHGVRSRAARLLGRAPQPHGEFEQLRGRLDEQDAVLAQLRLALEKATLALDQRMLDHYALTELVGAQLKLRADEIVSALASPDGAVAERLASEAALLDSYLIHHVARLGEQIEAVRTVVPSAPDLDLLLLVGEFDVVVPGAEQGVMAFLLRHGVEAIEPGVRAVLGRELRPGAVAVDVGATIGLHALTMAGAVGPEGRLICFEPVPRLAAGLRRTLALNGFASRAEVRAVALADTAGVSTFHVARHGPMSSLFALPDGTEAEAIEVERSSLDDQIPAGSRLDLVKLDVEGAEPLVWRGSERVRSENPTLVFVLEWSAPHLIRAGFAPAAVMAEIRAAGFAPFVIATDDPKGALSPLEDDPGALVDCSLLLRGG